MMITEITCDNCGEDLKTTAMSYDFRLVLSSQRKSNEGNSCFAIGFESPIKEDKHFCGLGCIKGWVNNDNQ